MSSHHIIRENQEAALILANGESCSDELLEQLLEWSPFILVLDGALERALMKGIKVDAVLGDFDSISMKKEDVDQEILFIELPDQNKTDLEKAFDYLLSSGHHSANILWATGRRLDHTFNNIFSMARYSASLNINLIDDQSRAFILPRSFKKFYPKGQKLSIFPIVDTQSVKTLGLKYNLNNEDLIVTKRTSSSNESVGDSLVEIGYESGILCMMECEDL